MTILYAFFITLAVLAALSVILWYPKTNYKSMVPLTDRINKIHIVVDFQADELLEICNLFLSLEQELRKPFFMRFQRYTINHDEIFSKLVAKLKTVSELADVLDNPDTLTDGD